MSLLGERLRQTREGRGIAFLQVEMETRIRATVIEALEQGDYANLPPEPFLRGLIRTYAAYLGLDSDEMLALYAADRTPPPVLPAPPPAAPPTTVPETIAPTAEETPRAEPLRKPAAIRVPSLRPPLPRPPARKPKLPEPSTPPESLALIESSSNGASENHTRARLPRRPVTLPISVALSGTIVLICIIGGILALTQIAPMLADKTTTPTRPAPTRTATIRPGTIATAIPTLAATALPLPTPRPPSATLKPSAAINSFNGLQLDVIEVSQVITLQVGVDGILVFNGTLAPGTTRTWSAKDSLYLQIENPKGALLELNGSNKWFAPRNFSETRALERQWELNAKGTPVPMMPVAPAAPPAPRVTPPLTP